MKLAGKLILVLALCALVAVPLVAESRRTFYTFEIIMPEEVNANPGEVVEVDGKILVTGMYWLHNFDLSASGMPYDYEIDPEWWSDVRILREWNPEDGLYRVPETFKMNITVPYDAMGAYVVNVIGQEHHSFREVMNDTYFVLAVGNASSKVNLNITDIILPNMIEEDEPFNLSFKVENSGDIATAVKVSILIPDGWEADDESKTLSVKGGSSAVGTFMIIPNGESGQVSFFAEYPFKSEIMNFTKVGPYLVPGEEITTTTTVPEPFYAPILGFFSSVSSPVVEWFEGVAGVYTVPVMIGVIIILIIVIVWVLMGMFKFVKTNRSEPEKMSNEVKSNVFSGVDEI